MSTTDTTVTANVDAAPVVQIPIPEIPNVLLTKILSTKRAHGSVGDSNFRAWLKTYISETLSQKVEVLSGGSLYVKIGKGETLFSCHVDTVHTLDESNKTDQQKLSYDPNFGVLGLDQPSTCLGADDGAGIYIMLEMLRDVVPGGYIFATGEERGGLGAREVLKSHRTLLQSYKRAVAFDRAIKPGSNPEVIYMQGGYNCASLAAANALKDAINKDAQSVFEMPWVVSPNGVFTDTKIYAEVIPECFNLCCFYSQQHTQSEWLDVSQLEQLINVCVSLDWDSLPVARIPQQVIWPTAGMYPAGSGAAKISKLKGKQKKQTQKPLDGLGYYFDKAQLSVDGMLKMSRAERLDAIEHADPAQLAEVFTLLAVRLDTAQWHVQLLEKALLDSEIPL